MSEGKKKKETNRKRKHNAIHFLLGFFHSRMQMTNEDPVLNYLIQHPQELSLGGFCGEQPFGGG